MNIMNNYGSTITTIYQNVIKSYERNEDDIRRIEEELNDINHEIELSSPKDLYKGWLMYKTIRELRIERRRCKNENELLKETYEYFKSQQGQAFKNKIQQLQGNATKVYEIQEHRTYRPRQRNDLTCTNETNTASKPFEEMLKEFKETKISMQRGKLKK